MPTYTVTLKATGAEVYRYSADVPVEWAGMEFATHDHTEAAAVPVVPAPPPRFAWTAVEFLLRFTPAERIAARAARKTDPTLDDFYSLLEQSPSVDSTSPNVARGLGYMAQQGLIAAGRMMEILHG